MIEEKKKVNRPLVYAILGVTLLVLAVSGSAYAFFTASASNTNAISGKTLDVKLAIGSVTKVSKGAGDLIPIYDSSVSGHTSQLATAITTANDCVDSNGYTVCQVYKVTVTNGGSNDTAITTKISVAGSTNIKWAKMTGRNALATGTGIDNLTSDTLSTNVAVKANGSTDLYFLVYLKNTGSNQTTTDAGKNITGTVTIEASTGGAQIEATFNS